MSKVVLIGGAGAPNYGDELIVKGWIDFFKEQLPGSTVTLYENIADKEKKLHGETRNIKFKDDLVKVAKSFSEIGFWEQVLRGYHFIDNGGVEKYHQFDLKPFFEADIVHLHGGGYLNNYDPEKGFYIGFLASLKEKYGKKIVATGIGFGPAPEPKKEQLELLNNIFAHYHAFELRDVDNFRWLKSKFTNGHFVNGLDDCYLYAITDIVKKDSSKKRLYLSFLAYNLNKVTSEYWDNLQAFSATFDEVLFFESYPWQDNEVFDIVKKKIPAAQKLVIKDSLYKKINVGPDDFAICARFHVHFILARAGVNGIYSKDSKYYNVKHQSIVDRGSDMKFTDFAQFSPPVVTEKEAYIAQQDVCLHEQKLGFCQSLYLP
tara:strand:- start:672 stop:1796 length:1125 start_codon:yes stop_codon:yes gene_type:complete